MMATDDRKDVAGLECPLCACPESAVVWTRDRKLKVNGQAVGSRVRARECAACGYRFQTSERIQGESSTN
jgi:transcriptional regulator NrdR family protein